MEKGSVVCVTALAKTVPRMQWFTFPLRTFWDGCANVPRMERNKMPALTLHFVSVLDGMFSTVLALQCKQGVRSSIQWSSAHDESSSTMYHLIVAQSNAKELLDYSIE